MAGKYARKRKFPVFPFVALLVLILAAAAVLLIGPMLSGSQPTEPAQTDAPAQTTLPAETTVPPTR